MNLYYPNFYGYLNKKQHSYRFDFQILKNLSTHNQNITFIDSNNPNIIKLFS